MKPRKPDPKFEKLLNKMEQFARNVDLTAVLEVDPILTKRLANKKDTPQTLPSTQWLRKARRS